MKATRALTGSRCSTRRSRWMRPCSCWKPVGSPSRRARRSRRRARPARLRRAPTSSSAAAISGNCEVFSLPSRDQRRTRPAGADLGDRADAVVLRFVDELRIVERRVGERREHRASDIAHAMLIDRLLIATLSAASILSPRCLAARLRRRPGGRLRLPARARVRRAVRGCGAAAPSGRRLRPGAALRRLRASTFLPFILPLMIRIRFSRYSSVYFDGSHSAARLLTSAFAMSSSVLRILRPPGSSNCAASTSSSAKRMTDSTMASLDDFDGGQMLRLAQDELGDADAARLANRLAQQRVGPLAALRRHQVVRRLEKPIVDLVGLDEVDDVDGARLLERRRLEVFLGEDDEVALLRTRSP